LGTACFLLLIAFLVAGCSGSGQSRRSNYSRIVTPLPPAFLTGPAALLLTNSLGFSARAEILPLRSGIQPTSAGELLQRGSKLLYAPESDEMTDTHRQPGGYSFIWDVAQSRGFVLSEALQGYAPLVSALHVTNLETTLGKASAQRFAGHPCEPVTVSAFSPDSPVASFEVWRAIDLHGFPVRIESATNLNTYLVNFSKIRLEAPSADIFSPPDGFTKYETPEAMADELAARQHNLKRRGGPAVNQLRDMQRPY
jgi:hypothetical protein